MRAHPHVVGGIAAQRLHLERPLPAARQILDHLGNADAASFMVSYIVTQSSRAASGPCRKITMSRSRALAGDPRIGRDQNRRSNRLPRQGRSKARTASLDQRKLWDQVVRRRRPVRLVIGIKLVAEVTSDLSNTMARWVGRLSGGISRNSFHSMLQKPSNGIDCSPSDLRLSGGSA